jgi:ankyrin repeat protein
MSPFHTLFPAAMLARATAVVIPALTAACGIHEVSVADSNVISAVEASLPLLQRSGAAWFEERTCVSCHHLALGMMSVGLARERGFSIDEDLFAGQLAHLQDSLSTPREQILQGKAGINGQLGQAYKLWALASANEPADANTDARALFLAGIQGRDGHWRSGSHRPPLEDSEFTATALAARAMQLYVPSGHARTIASQVAEARAWLEAAVPRSTEERVMQLFGLAWTGASRESIALARTALLNEQRPDGGWAQLPTRTSDAYATGQTLAALNQVADLSVDDAVYQRGLEFLLRTQRPDGTWHVATRRKSGGLPYFETGFPHGEDQFISYAASAWATMALTLAIQPGMSPIFTCTAPLARKPTSSPPTDGFTPLMEAVLQGQLADVRALLDSGSDVNAGSENGLTALMCAAGDVAVARLLIERGANVDARTALGFNAAILAAGRHGGGKVLELLAEHGADLSVQAGDGTTALLAAAMSGDHEKIDFLLAHGVDVDIHGKNSETALTVAVWQGDARTVRHLLARGADPDAKHNADEETPLFSATLDGFPEVVEALLAAGARTDARDEDRKTPLMWAATVDWGDDRSLRTLLAHGADPLARDKDGATPLDLAERHANRLAAETLRSASAKAK